MEAALAAYLNPGPLARAAEAPKAQEVEKTQFIPRGPPIPWRLCAQSGQGRLLRPPGPLSAPVRFLPELLPEADSSPNPLDPMGQSACCE